jgi:hypothetical protein
MVTIMTYTLLLTVAFVILGVEVIERLAKRKRKKDDKNDTGK